MNDTILKKYAHLLINYCIQPKKNESIIVSTSTKSSLLLPYLYEFALENGAHMEFDVQFHRQLETFYTYATDDQLTHLPIAAKEKAQKFNASISISAPLECLSGVPNISTKRNQRTLAFKSLHQLKMSRSINDNFRWSICNYPTIELAKRSKMTLTDYTNFLINACYLNTEDPIRSWTNLRESQQRYVDYLNTVSELHFLNDNIDLKVGVRSRIWVNSDGRRNMPSGEVFTSPIENEINGNVSFSYPSRFFDQSISGISLTFEKGIVTKYSAKKNQKLLDLVFFQANANKCGEIAIGTNYNIQKQSFNTLFDEKMGGTFHLALGNSYPETGGKNKSSVHWDLISCMRSGEIFADKKCIYKNGKFLI